MKSRVYKRILARTTRRTTVQQDVQVKNDIANVNLRDLCEGPATSAPDLEDRNLIG